MFARIWIWVILVCTLASIALAQPAFVSEWHTTSPDESITLPLEVDGTYNFTVNWGDGNISNVTSWDGGNETHVYAIAGTYIVNITGEISGFRFNGGGDKDKIYDISEWGPLHLGNTNGYFYSCTNLNVTATDALNLTGTTYLNLMFASTNVSVVNFSLWDVSSITEMALMFYNTPFNGNISNWITSNVTTMSGMFSSANAFNGDLNDWDVSNTVSMSGLFSYTDSFNGNISGWDVSNVTDMGVMFENATSFNQDLSSWNISAVVNMTNIFDNTNMSQDNLYSTIRGWANQSMQGDLLNEIDVSVMTDMSSLFSGLSSFNQNLSDWNVSNVIDMNYMFGAASEFDGNISSWDVGNVTNMSFMFSDAVSFNGSINSWNLRNVLDISGMFYQANSFNQGLDNWEFPLVTNLNEVFAFATDFNQNIGGWNTSNITSMYGTFAFAGDFNQNISGWNTSAVTNMYGLFSFAESFNQPIGIWDVSSVTEMSSLFGADYYELFVNVVHGGTFNSSFNQDLTSWNISSVEYMDSFFTESINFSGNLSGWNTSSVLGIDYIFYGSKNFSGDLSDWDLSGVTNLSYLFSESTSFDGDIDGWTTGHVLDMSSLLQDTINFTSDISGWNISSVTNMDNMFNNATLFNQNLSSWYTPTDTLPTYVDYDTNATSWQENYKPNFFAPSSTSLSSTYESNETTAAYNLTINFTETVDATFTQGVDTLTFCDSCTNASATLLLENGLNQFTLNMTDVHGYKNSTTFNITFNLDSDGNGTIDAVQTDDDNDGVNDTLDSVTGNVTNIYTNYNLTNVTVNATDNLSRIYTGNQKVNIVENQTTIVTYEHNFTASNLTLANLFVLKNTNSMIVRIGNEPITKNITFDGTHLNQTGSVCVYDAPISSFDAISSSCDQANETQVSCDGTVKNGYKCTSQTVNGRDLFTVTGLNHSGVQFCEEDWVNSSWSACVSDSRSRTAIDVNSCGSTIYRPTLTESCVLDNGNSGNSIGGGSGPTGQVAPPAQALTVARVIVSNMKADVVKVITIPGKFAVTKLSVLPNKLISYVQFTIKETTPLSKLQTPVYSYLDMTPSGSSTSFFSEVNVSFTVNASWIKSQNIDADTIKLYRYTDGKWVNLPTTVLKRGATTYEFVSRSPGFSTFAISGEIKATPIAEVIEVTPTPDTQEVIIESEPTKTTVAAPNEDKSETTFPSWVLISIISFIIFVAIAVGLYLYMSAGRKKTPVAAQQSMEANKGLYDYYIKEHVEGYTHDAILRAIRQVGWSEVEIAKLEMALKRDGKI